MVSGGPNGGSQYNPNKISPMGGNGQSGKKAEKAMQLRPSGGGESGATKALTQQISGAEGVVTTAPAAGNMGRPTRNSLANLGQARPVVGITDETQNKNESIFAGTSLPGGVGPEGLNLPPQPTDNPELNEIIKIMPAIEFWASQPDTPQTTKDYVRFLRTILPS